MYRQYSDTISTKTFNSGGGKSGKSGKSEDTFLEILDPWSQWLDDIFEPPARYLSDIIDPWDHEQITALPEFEGGLAAKEVEPTNEPPDGGAQAWIQVLASWLMVFNSGGKFVSLTRS
jgi:hypothetical protein